MKKIFLIILIFTITAFYSFTAQQAGTQTETLENVQGASNFIIAQVDDEVILMSDLRDRYNQYRSELTQMNKPVPVFDMQTKELLTKKLIEDMFLLLFAKSEQLEVTEAQINKRLNEIKVQYRLETEEEIAIAANRSGFMGRVENVNQLRDKIRILMLLMNTRQELVLRRFRDKLIQPNEEQMRTFYNNNQKYFLDQDSVKIQHLVVRVNEDANFEELEKSEKKLKEISEKAKSGADFSKLVQEFSDPMYKSNNGFVSTQFLKREEIEALFPKYVSHAFSLNAGDISPIIVDGPRRIILKVTEKKSKQLKPFEEVKEFIAQIILTEQGNKLVDEWIEKQYKERLVKIHFDRLRISQ